VLNKGESFGELALIHNINRSATVKTLSKSKLWALSRPSFVTALESVYNSIYQENKSFIESVNLF